MKQTYQEQIQRFNCLSKELDALYHRAARKLGMADSSLLVLYTIYEKGDSCLLYDIYSESGVSKQTINSALRKLEQDEILYLKQEKGKTKRVCLTENGREYMKKTAVRLFEAECNAFCGWTEEEMAMHLMLLEKYNRSFREQIENM